MALFTRPLTEQESSDVERGLRASDGVWSRHCQILWASSKGKSAQTIAEALDWHVESVRRLLRTFNRRGLEALRSHKPPGPKSLEDELTPEALRGLLELLRQSPQAVDSNEGNEKDDCPPVWTAEMLAQVAHQRGLLPEGVRGERLRRMLTRQGITWKQAKGWLKSPDAHYAKKKNGETP